MAAPQSIKATAAALRLRASLSTILPGAAILGFVVLVAGTIVAHAGGLLIQVYTPAAVAVGALLYWRHAALYVGFTWWLWFVTPEVRRLAEYQGEGFNPENPMMLAPYVVIGFAFFTLLRHLPKVVLAKYFPFYLVLLGIFYGELVGVYRGGWQAPFYDLLTWMFPVVFAFYLTVHWHNYPHFRQVIQRTFVWGVLAIGLYALIQFYYLPDWDRAWMLKVSMASLGNPEPLEVRVFSTLNSPGPFALIMMAGLLLILSSRGLLRWPAAGVGYTSFLLSLVRSAWGGWIVGLLFIIAQRGRFRPRLLVTLTVVGLLAWPLLTVGPVAEVVNERLETISNIEEDKSAQERQAFYSNFAQNAFFNPVGQGLGSTGLATKLGTDTQALENLNFDSGLMNIPFVLGWPGSLLYLGGLVWLLRNALRGEAARLDLFAAANQGIMVALLFQLLFGNSLIGLPGVVFWSSLGLSLAAHRHYTSLANDPVLLQAPGDPNSDYVPKRDGH